MSRGGKRAEKQPEWVHIQKKTFTNWCNKHLQKQDTMIEDLAVDLGDGVRLIVLLEVLSEKKLGRYNKKPRLIVQRMENLQTALNFITKTEKIRLVNIGEWALAECLQLICCSVVHTSHFSVQALGTLRPGT